MATGSSESPSRSENQDLVGKTLGARYEVQRELKRGGFGVVYLASDKQLHSRPVVIKLLLDDAYDSEYVVQKFRQEVEALSRIDHPGIVGIVDAGELEDGKPFIVMQFVDGTTLRSAMKSEGMDVERASNIIRQIGRALSAAHSRGIYHRDLKPENIMLQDLGQGEEQVKIIDFGIAKVKDSVIAPSTSLNLSPGTVAYMAPEQLSGRPITAATDIFAFGAIAYEMMTGRKPFNPETGFQLLEMQQTGVRVKPSDLRPILPPAGQDAILKALSYSPHDRYQNARHFGDELARSLTDDFTPGNIRNQESVALPPTQIVTEETPLAGAATPPAEKTIQALFQPALPGSAAGQTTSASGSRPQSRRTIAAVVGLSFLALVTAAVVAVWYFTRSRSEKPAPVTAAERSLNYGLTVQKVRNGKPYQNAFASSGQEIFESGWKFRMEITSPQSGCLYLLNEGPAPSGDITYNMLFPAPSTNSGSPFLEANQRVQTGWMVFVEQQGTEKFWMVWAAEAVPELEAVKESVNQKDKGEIRDNDQADAVREFLRKNSASKPKIEVDRNNKQTNVKGAGPILVNLIELEHH
ncbi:MAG TPA: serine/threonine-protein kinase [Pyrinomonadaceae bacterium]|nr:serine/threonine-protein kinase [Pyrinomonadaceae bacterium]